MSNYKPEENGCGHNTHREYIIPLVYVLIADDNIERHFNFYDPADHIILNWCEEISGIKFSEWLVAKRRDILGFTFTGADSEILSLAQDKYRVKNPG